MNLKEYLFYLQLSEAAFAKLCDLSGSYVSAIIRGDIKPSDKTLRIIERVTEGLVTSRTFFKAIKIPKSLASKVVPLSTPEPEEERKIV
jgi:hypothetical protein